MFPFFEPISWIVIYSFGLTLTICFFLFVWMLKKLCVRFSSDFMFFSKNIIWYFLSVFLFSRLFYIIWRWSDMKYINNPLEFFIMSNYNFSLAWAIFWFFLVFLINLKTEKKQIQNFIDPLVLSFLFILFIWFAWAHFWGQVYWRETHIWIEILYKNSFSPVPFQVPIFPLAIVYTAIFFILFSSLYIMSMFINIKGLLWYLWLIIFSSIILIFEFFSWKIDIFKTLFWINLMQIFSLVFIWFIAYNAYKLIKDPKNINKAIFK